MNRRLNIKDIAVILAESTGKNSNDLELFLKELVTLMSEQIFIDKLVVIKGLGTFKIIPIEKRESIDVNTKERITIPGHYKLSFLPEKSLREVVNKPFSFFESIEINEEAAFAEMNTISEDEKLIDEKEDKDVEDTASDLEENELDKEEDEETISEVTPEVKELIEEETTILEPKEEVELDVIQEASNETFEQEPTLEVVNTTNLIEESLNETSPEVIEETEEESEPVEEVVVNKEVIIPENQIKKKESTLKVILSVLFVVLLAVIGIVGYMNRDLFFHTKNDIIVSQHPETEVEVTVSDSIEEMVEIEEEIQTEPEVVLAEEKKEPVASPKETTTPQQKNEDVIAKVKMQTGSRLTLLALEYYGSKVFWVYIYDYNKSVIKNPNNVPIGTEISIPNPKLYGIDPKNAESIKKASARQTELLSQ